MIHTDVVKICFESLADLALRDRRCLLRVHDLFMPKRFFLRTEVATTSLSWFVDYINLVLFPSLLESVPRQIHGVFPHILCWLPKRRSMDDGCLAPKVDQFLSFRIKWNSLPMLILSLVYTYLFTIFFLSLPCTSSLCARCVDTSGYLWSYSEIHIFKFSKVRSHR